MSYIARLASRSAVPSASGTSSSAGVVPAVASGSPIAAFDQRYHLPGFAELGTGAQPESSDDAVAGFGEVLEGGQYCGA